METAARPQMAIDKGMAGPGLLAYIVTSRFAGYPAGGYLRAAGVRSLAGQWPIWSSPLYQLMAERERASHVVATADTIMPC
jgi:transposase